MLSCKIVTPSVKKNYIISREKSNEASPHKNAEEIKADESESLKAAYRCFRKSAIYPIFISSFVPIVAKKLLTLHLHSDNISALKRQHRCEYGGKEKAAMKKNCFMMMAMMMRMCGMRTFSDATFSDSSIITD